jgi:hypothetical protein
MLTVDVTPDGHGDCVRSVMKMMNESEGPTRRRMFVKPHKMKMNIRTFRDLLRRRSTGCDDPSTSNGRHAIGEFPLYCHAGRAELELEYRDTERGVFDSVSSPPVVYYSKQVRHMERRNRMTQRDLTNFSWEKINSHFSNPPPRKE